MAGHGRVWAYLWAPRKEERKDRGKGRREGENPLRTGWLQLQLPFPLPGTCLRRSPYRQAPHSLQVSTQRSPPRRGLPWPPGYSRALPPSSASFLLSSSGSVTVLFIYCLAWLLPICAPENVSYLKARVLPCMHPALQYPGQSRCSANFDE